jgi:hypothetical protein
MEGLIVLGMYVVLGGILVLLGLLFFLRSFGSRRTRRCPQCGEEVTTELMTATRCNTCGAAFDGRGN